MTSEEYTNTLMQLAAKCRAFAADTCQEWRIAIPRDKIPDNMTDREDLGEVRDLYLTLEALESKATSVFQRATSLLRLGK